MDENSVYDDIKLRSLPVVVLKRIDLMQHIDELSEDCLNDYLKELQRKVAESRKPETLTAVQPSTSAESDNDEIQVIEIKQAPKVDRTKVELHRSSTQTQDQERRKSRKSGGLALSVFKPSDTPRRITSSTAIADMFSFAVPQKESEKGLNEGQGKLTTLKQKEKRLFGEIRKKKNVVDPLVQEELNAMAPVGFGDSIPSFGSSATEKIKKPKNFESFRSSKKFLQNPAQTYEDKFRILDEMDKLLHSSRQTTESQRLVGTCPDMCPEKERYRRSYQSQLSPFEMIAYPMNTEGREELMVKEYARSSADQDTPLPHELRPMPVLEMTMEYLCRNIVDRCELDDDMVEEWYMFMWDRTRAIRKDITQQDLCSPEAARLIELTARFHIHCAERLSDQELSVYDEKINTENLTKCLQTLKYMYNDLATVGVACPNAPEFLCYSILLNLNNPAIITEARHMPEEILQSEPIRFALSILAVRETKNYIRFFKLVKQTTYLNCCLLRRYFNEMRLNAFKTMIYGFTSRAMTTSVYVEPLIDALLYECAEDCINDLELCNLCVEIRNDRAIVVLDKKTFQWPEVVVPAVPSFRYIQEKKRTLLSEVIWGGPLPEEEHIQRPLKNSFNSNGLVDTIFDDIFEESNSADKKPESFQVPEFGSNDEEMVEEFPKIQKFGKTEIAFNFEKPPESVANNAALVSSKSIFASSPTTPPFLGFGVAQNINVPNRSPQSGFSFSNIFNIATTVPSMPSVLPPIFSNAFGGAKDEVSQRPTSSTTISSNIFKLPVNTTDTLVTSSTATESQSRPKFDNIFKIPTSTSTSLPTNTATKRQLEEEDNKIKQLEIEKEKLRMIEEKKREELIAAERKREEAEKARAEQESIKKQREEEAALEKKRQEKIAMEKRQQEELKRKSDMEKKLKAMAEEKRVLDEHRRNAADKKLQTIRKKYKNWKVQKFIEVWKRKTWASAEGRKVEKYMKHLKAKYPPVCDKELLDGNPYGFLIPSALLLDRRKSKNMPQSKCRFPRSIPSSFPALPLVHIGRAIAEKLKSRVTTLYPDPTSPFRSIFPWKLVLCLPDDEETSVRLDTFMEMHFVERYDWKLGEESSPLTTCVHQIDSLEFHIVVRRVRGCALLEGSSPNPEVLTGSNSAIFFLTDDRSTLSVAKRRLDSLRAAPGGFQVPIITFVFGNRVEEKVIRNELNLANDSHVIICCGSSQQSLVTTLSGGLTAAADISAPVSTVRSVSIESFMQMGYLDRLWRRAERAVINFNILMKGPGQLINFWNSCVDELYALFTDPKLEKISRVAPEFESLLSRIEAPLQLCSPPIMTDEYKHRLDNLLRSLKLPTWPNVRLRSTQALNYQLHKYCVAVAIGNKAILKDLKWRVYRDVQKTLLWKGFDIYCDEDINAILLKMPWIRVVENFTRTRIEFMSKPLFFGLSVTYDKTDIDDFCYKTPLLDKLVAAAPKFKNIDIISPKPDTKPHPENDSILLSFAAAIERQLREEEDLSERKRKRSLSEELRDILNRNEEVEEVVMEDRSTNDLKRGYDQIDNTLMGLEENLKRRRAELDELMCELNPTLPQVS